MSIGTENGQHYPGTQIIGRVKLSGLQGKLVDVRQTCWVQDRGVARELQQNFVMGRWQGMEEVGQRLRISAMALILSLACASALSWVPHEMLCTEGH